MINFLDLKTINNQYQQELKDACARVIDSGWYIMGNELTQLKSIFPLIVAPSTQLVWPMDWMR